MLEQAEQQKYILQEMSGTLRAIQLGSRDVVPALNHIYDRVAQIERTVSYLEHRIDAAAALQTDTDRHLSQAARARSDCEGSDRTPAQKARRRRELLMQERYEFADRQISMFRGSCFMCCLQPVLHWYTNRLTAQLAQDQAAEEAEAAERTA